MGYFRTFGLIVSGLLFAWSEIVILANRDRLDGPKPMFWWLLILIVFGLVFAGFSTWALGELFPHHEIPASRNDSRNRRDRQ
jgi:heme/copper-type cytochrome/quinol oxidase subunit 3